MQYDTRLFDHFIIRSLAPYSYLHLIVLINFTYFPHCYAFQTIFTLHLYVGLRGMFFLSGGSAKAWILACIIYSRIRPHLKLSFYIHVKSVRYTKRTTY